MEESGIKYLIIRKLVFMNWDMSRFFSRKYLTLLIASFPVLILDYLFYVNGSIDSTKFIISIILYPIFILSTLFIWDLRNKYVEEKRFNFYKYIYIGVGGWITWLITFFGGAFILWYYNINLKTLGVPLWLSGLIFFIIPWVVGGVIGYYWGKKRGFEPYGL